MRSDHKMNTPLKYLGLLAVLPLFTIGLVGNYNISANAQEVLQCMSGEVTVIHVSNPKPICLNESTAKRWAQLGIVTIVTPSEEMTETMEEPMKETIEEPMKEIAPGSVLRLSRANVPAIIPLHQGFY